MLQEKLLIIGFTTMISLCRQELFGVLALPTTEKTGIMAKCDAVRFPAKVNTCARGRINEMLWMACLE